MCAAWQINVSKTIPPIRLAREIGPYTFKFENVFAPSFYLSLSGRQFLATLKNQLDFITLSVVTGAAVRVDGITAAEVFFNLQLFCDHMLLLAPD